MSGIIDVHAHIVPSSFPAGPIDPPERRWPCVCHDGARATVMIADKAFREIDRRSWDADARIDDMDRMGVNRQALSPMPELLSYWFSPAAGLDMCRWMNGCIADLISRHPARFAGLGIVPLQDAALAAQELTQLQADGFNGVEVGSNVNGDYLGDPRFDEFFAEAARLGMAVFVHALHPAGADRLQTTPDLIPFAAFPIDTALCAMSIIRAGVPERHPTLRLGFSHGGGAVVPLAHRLGRGASLTSGFAGRLARSPAAYAAQFYYDNLVYDPTYAAFLANAFAPGHVFCGTDYPYAIMDDAPAVSIASAAFDDPDSVRSGAAAAFLGLVT